MLVDARGSEGASTCSCGNFSQLEVSEEFLPFGVGGDAVFLAWAQGPAAGEEGQVGLDGLVGVEKNNGDGGYWNCPNGCPGPSADGGQTSPGSATGRRRASAFVESHVRIAAEERGEPRRVDAGRPMPEARSVALSLAADSLTA